MHHAPLTLILDCKFDYPHQRGSANISCRRHDGHRTNFSSLQPTQDIILRTVARPTIGPWAVLSGRHDNGAERSRRDGHRGLDLSDPSKERKLVHGRHQ